MVPAEFVAQDHAYRMLKQRMLMEPRAWVEPINILALAEALGLSRTPVREALFRLMGEGLIEPAEPGSYRLFRPGAGALGDLYAWSQQLMLIVVAVTDRADLVGILHSLQQRRAEPELSQAHWQLPLTFQILGDATGNSEISRQVRNLNERLIGARLAEAAILGDNADEVRRLVNSADPDIKNSIRRKIIAYHRRRFRQAEAISNAIRGM